MLTELDQIEGQALQVLSSVQDETSLEAWRIAYLGRSSPLMQVFDQLGRLAREERPVIGRRANEVKRSLEVAFTARSEALRQSVLLRSLQSEIGYLLTRSDLTHRAAPSCLHLFTDSYPRLCRYGISGLSFSRSRNR